MIRRITTMLAAFAIALATFAPTAADARDRRGYRDYGHHYRDRDRDHGDAVAAGVIGLVLGLAIASAANDRDRCDDRYGCAPPPPPRQGCYDPCAREDGYYDQSYDPRYDQGRDDPYYDEEDTRAQYDRDYGLEGGRYADPRQCTQQVRRWDERSRRYVIVNVPC